MEKNDYKLMKTAIKQGNLIEVKNLISENKERLNDETPFGSWLQVAAAHGKIDIATYLIDSGIDINKCCGVMDGGPLAEACSKGYVDIVILLLERGAVIDTSAASKNPLFAAAYGGNMEIVKLLVEKGIDIKATYEIGDIKECDAYEYARQYGQIEIANYLKSLL